MSKTLLDQNNDDLAANDARIKREQEAAIRKQEQESREAQRLQGQADREARKQSLTATEGAAREQGIPTWTGADGNLYPDNAKIRDNAEKDAAAKLKTEQGAQADKFTQEGRKFFTSRATGAVIPLESDAQLEANRLAKGESLRKAALDDELRAIDTETSDPSRKPIATPMRTKLEKQLAAAHREGSNALIGHLTEAGKQVTGGNDFIPFNEAPTTEATAATNRASQLQAAPDGKLNDTDLSTLESTPALAPHAAIIRNLTGALARDDENNQFHMEQADKAFALKMKRDAPAKYEQMQREKRAAMDPATLGADIEAGSADYTARAENIKAQFAPIQAKRDQTKAALADLETQNAERVAKGLTAGEIVHFQGPDGKPLPWAKDLAEKREQIAAEHDNFEASNADHLALLQSKESDLQRDGAALNEAAALHREKQAGQKEAALTSLAATPGMAPVAKAMRDLDTERATRLADLQAVHGDNIPEAAVAAIDAEMQTRREALAAEVETRSKTVNEVYNGMVAAQTAEDEAEQAKATKDMPGFRGTLQRGMNAIGEAVVGADPLRVATPYHDTTHHAKAAREALKQSLGVNDLEAQAMLDDAEKRDWRGAGSAFVKDDLFYKLTDAITLGKGKAGTAYVDSEPTRLLSTGEISVNPKLLQAPDLYAKAVEQSGGTPEAQAAAMRQLPDIRQQFGAQALTTFDEYKGSGFREWVATQPNLAKETPINKALAYADHLRANSGPLGQFIDQITTHLQTGVTAVGAQVLGVLGLATGNEWSAKAANSINHANGLKSAMLEYSGAQDSLFNRAVGQTVDIAPSVLVSMGGGFAARGALIAAAGTRPGLLVLRTLSTTLRAAKTKGQFVSAMGKLASSAAMTGAATAGAGQTAGAQFADTYGSLRSQGFSHEDAVKASRMPALFSGAITAILTLGFGTTGAQRIFQQPATKELVKSRFANLLKRAGLSERTRNIVTQAGKGALEEQPEEIIDELWNQISTEMVQNPHASLFDTVQNFVEHLPELALAVGAMGGAGGAVAGYQQPTTAELPNPANRPENIAAAESAIDEAQMPNMDEPTLDRYKDAARTVLYIAQGTPLTDLPADSLAELDVIADPANEGKFLNGRIVTNKDGIPEVQEYPAGKVAVTNPDGTPAPSRPVRVRIVNGEPVISQATLDQLETHLPAVRNAIPLSEKDHLSRVQEGTAKIEATTPASHGVSPEAGAPSVASDSEVASAEAEATPASARPLSEGSPEAERSTLMAKHFALLGLKPEEAALVADHLIKTQGVIGENEIEQSVSSDYPKIIRALGITGSLAPGKSAENPLKAPADLAERITAVSTPKSEAPPAKAAAKPNTNPDVGTLTLKSHDADAFLHARKAAIEAKNKDGTRAIPVADRRRAVSLFSALDKALAKYGAAFPKINYTQPKAGDMAYRGLGVSVDIAGDGRTTSLNLDLGALFAGMRSVDEKAFTRSLDKTIKHELRHLVTGLVIDLEEAAALWEKMPAALRATVYGAYYHPEIIRSLDLDGKKATEAAINAAALSKVAEGVAPKFKDGATLPAADPAHMAYEFLRMLDEDADGANGFAGVISEAADADATFGEAVIKFLNSVMSKLKALLASGLDSETRILVKELSARIASAREALLARLKQGAPAKAAAKPKINLAAEAADNSADEIDMTPTPKPGEKVKPKDNFKPVTGSSGIAYTDENDAIEYKWAVVEIDGLHISHSDNGTPNKAFPSGGQPRDRSSAASEAQVADIAANFNLDRLSASNTVSDGSPFIGDDGVVESGNGRAMGARRSYAADSKVSQLYKSRLAATAATYGLTPDQVSGFKNPLLVRIRLTEVNREAFVELANVPTVAPMTELEQAPKDAEKITPALFESFIPSDSGELVTAANAEFIQRFLTQVVPASQVGKLIVADGDSLNQQGLRRLNNALFVYAYGNSAETLAALGRFTESLDSADVNVSRALIALAPRFAEQNARIAAGELRPLSITADLAKALQITADLRSRVESVENWMQQKGMPGIDDDVSPVVSALVSFLHTGRNRPRQMIDTLDRYARAIDAAGDPRQAGMFGEDSVTSEELLKLVLKHDGQASMGAGSKAADSPNQTVDFTPNALLGMIERDRFSGPNWYRSTLTTIKKALYKNKPVQLISTEVSHYGGKIIAVIDGKTLPLTHGKVRANELHFHFGHQKFQPVATAKPATPTHTEDFGGKEVWHSGSIQGAYDPQKADMDAVYGPGFYSATAKSRAEGYGKQPASQFIITAKRWFDHDAPISHAEALRIAAFIEAPHALDSLFEDEKSSNTPIIGEDVWNALKEATSSLMANEALAAAGYDGATYTGNDGADRDYIVWSAAQVQKSPATAPVKQSGALRVYRKLTELAAEGTLNPSQSSKLESAEAALGQSFLFDAIDAKRTLKPAEDLILAQQTASKRTFADDSSPEQLKLENMEEKVLESYSKGFDEAMEEYYQFMRDSVGTNPARRVSAQDVARAKGEHLFTSPTGKTQDIGKVVTPTKAAELVEEWKALAHAERKGGKNSGKIVLSLFDSTGVWSQPWREAGYDVVQIDQNIVNPGAFGHEIDVMEIDREWLEDNGLDMVHIVLAACPCTEFASSGARWFAEKDANGRTQKAKELVHHSLAIIEYLQPDGFWAIENPIGRLKSVTSIPDEGLQFEPHHYGDPFTKRTQIFGTFNPDLPQANVEPTGGSFAHNLRGDNEADKELRSKTFEGFAYAFFAANHDNDNFAKAQAAADAAPKEVKPERPTPSATPPTTSPEQLRLFASSKSAEFAADKKIITEGGARRLTGAEAAGLAKIIRVGGEARRRLLPAVWSMYQNAYKEIGMQFPTAEKLFASKTLWDVVMDETTKKPIAFYTSKIKPTGYKATALGSDGSFAGKVAVRGLLYRLKEDGYWAELSDAPAHLANKAGVPRVAIAEVEALLGKKVTPLNDGWSYERDIPGLQKAHIKSIFGLPWPLHSNQSAPTSQPSINGWTPLPIQTSARTSRTTSPQSPWDTKQGKHSPTTPANSVFYAPSKAQLAQFDQALKQADATAERLRLELSPAFLRAVDESIQTGQPPLYPMPAGMPPSRATAGLNRSSRIIEARFFQHIAENPKGAQSEYLRLAKDDFGNARYLNADLARNVFPDYAKDQAFRTAFERATIAPAGYVVFALLYSRFTTRVNGNRDKIIMLAGGPASGKTTVAKRVLSPSLSKAAAIIDSVMAGLGVSSYVIDTALAAGITPEVSFIFRPFQSAMIHAVKRMTETGRPIPVEIAASSHYNAQTTFLALADKYAGKAIFKVLTNTGTLEKIATESVEFLREKVYSSIDETTDSLTRQYLEILDRDTTITGDQLAASKWGQLDRGNREELSRGHESRNEKDRETGGAAESLVAHAGSISNEEPSNTKAQPENVKNYQRYWISRDGVAYEVNDHLEGAQYAKASSDDFERRMPWGYEDMWQRGWSRISTEPGSIFADSGTDGRQPNSRQLKWLKDAKIYLSDKQGRDVRIQIGRTLSPAASFGAGRISSYGMDDMFAPNANLGLGDLVTPKVKKAKQELSTRLNAGTSPPPSLFSPTDGLALFNRPPSRAPVALPPAKAPTTKAQSKEERQAAQSKTLADAIMKRLEGHELIPWSELFSMADTAFGGTQADGIYTVKDAYDAAEMAINMTIAKFPSYDTGEPAQGGHESDVGFAVGRIHALKALIKQLPTQTKRTEETDQLQQFSTVPPLAFVAAWAANLADGPSEIVLEPSAGIGGLVAFSRARKNTVIANELSKRRAAVLRLTGIADQVFTENAEQINNVLPAAIKPTVVLMNPPFSTSPTGMKGTDNAIKHIESALARLAPGGRLVAIVGSGMAHDRPAFQAWWKRMGEKHHVRANIQVNGAEYAKYGTTWDNQLVVIDKVAPPDTAANPAENWRPLTPADLTREDYYGLPVRLKGLKERGLKIWQVDTARGTIKTNGAGHFTFGIDGVEVLDAATTPAAPSGPIYGRVESIDELPELLYAIRHDRPAISSKPTGPTGDSGPKHDTPNGDLLDGLKDHRPNAGKGTAGDGVLDGGVDKPTGGSDGTEGSGDDSEGVDSGNRQDAGETNGEVGPTHVKHDAAGELTDAVYDAYRPTITFPGAKMPPTHLAESAAMAAVEPPEVSYKPKIDVNVYADPKAADHDQRLSAHALESITLAGHAHEQTIPAPVMGIREAEDWLAEFKTPRADRFRRGFFIGDGTGAGKGRQIAGVMLDNINQGRKRHVWISESSLFKDAKRDLNDVFDGGDRLFNIGDKFSPGDSIKNTTGIGYISYGTLQSREKVSGEGMIPKSRVDQLVEWLGADFDGVIAFDEAHNMASAMETAGSRGSKKPSKRALAGLQLQQRLPNARVLYLSATGATEVANLAYAERLGVWGPGTPFSSRESFVSSIAAGGVAAMELIAQNLKAMGLYVARAISWHDVAYDRMQHKLTHDQTKTYDALAVAWQGVLANMDEAMLLTGITSADPDTGDIRTNNSTAKGVIRSKFWGTHQRFFNQMITAMKMPTVLARIKTELAAEKSVVIQLVNTQEASLGRALSKAGEEAAANDEEVDLEELDLSPLDQLLQMVQNAYPVNQMEEFSYTDDQGVAHTGSRVARDSAGNPIINQEAVAMRDALLDRLSSLKVPSGPLEILIDELGADNVAEVTGRSKRVVWKKDKDGRTVRAIEKRTQDNGFRETDEFQSGKRRVLVFSKAGGTGRSFHADRKAKNRQQRVHILLQPGWQASAAVQGLGRTHRTNQEVSPHFTLAETDVVGEKRFMSSIARRLDQLGALTKGQRQTGSQGFFQARDNLESLEAKAALSLFFGDAMRGNITNVPMTVLEDEMGLKLRDNQGNAVMEMPSIIQFLNRLLSLTLDKQNYVFDAFSQRLDQIIETKLSAGTLDQGLETLSALNTTEQSRETVYSDKNSGSKAELVKLALTQATKRAGFDTVNALTQNSHVSRPWATSKRTGKIFAQTGMRNMTLTDGRVVDAIRVTGVTRSEWMPMEDFHKRYDRINYPIATVQEKWDAEFAAAPATEDEEVNVLTGTMLPIWDKIPGIPRIVRVQTDAGKRMIGRVIPNDMVAVMVQDLTGKIESLSPIDAVGQLRRGEKVRLSNGWTMKPTRLSGETRFEIIGPSLNDQTLLAAAGVMKERIAFNMRYFLPYSNGTVPVLTALATSFRFTMGLTPATTMGAGRIATLEETAIQDYLDLPDVAVPITKQPAAKRAIRAAGAASTTAYGLPTRTGNDRDRGRLDELRLRAQRTWQGLMANDATAVKAAFAEKDSFSTLLHEFTTHALPSFDIRGAIISNAADFAAFALATRTPYFESVKIAVLDMAQQVIHSQVIHVGGLNSSIADPKIMAGIITAAKMLNPKAKLSGWILSHNHPSGDPAPSDADKRITRTFVVMGDLIGLPLIDHVITNGERYFSFREIGMTSSSTVEESVDMTGSKGTNPKLPILPTPSRDFHIADWEVIPSGTSKVLNDPGKTAGYLSTLRTADPDHYHVLFLDTRLALRAVERIPTNVSSGKLFQSIVLGAAREGANSFMLSLPVSEYDAPTDEQRHLISRLRGQANSVGLQFTDAISPTSTAYFSYKESGMLEAAGEYSPDSNFARSSIANQANQDYTTTHESPDPYTGHPSHINSSNVTGDQGQAISDELAQRLRAGLREGQETGYSGRVLAGDRSRAFGTTRLTYDQWDKLHTLDIIGEGAEAKVYADRKNGTVYKVLNGFNESPKLGIWPKVFYTAKGKLDYHYEPANRPRQFATRLAIQNLIGGTPTEIVGIGPEGHVITKQPLSPDAKLEQHDESSRAVQLQLAILNGGLVRLPPEMLKGGIDLPPVYIAVVEGHVWLITDLHADNFVADNSGKARMNDPVVGQIPRQMFSKVNGLPALIKRAGAAARANAGRSKRMFTASKAAPAAGPLARLGWNHLDKMLSSKVAALTQAPRDTAADAVARWSNTPNVKPFADALHSIKRELFPDQVLPIEVLAAKREMEIKSAMGGQRAMDMVRALSGNPKFSDLAYPKEFAENPLHRRQVMEAMMGEREMTTLPKPLQKLAEKLRATLVEIGREAVKQGRMSLDTFENLRENYMPHYYKEEIDAERSLFKRFRLGIRDILAQRTTAWHITDTANKDKNGEYRLVAHNKNQWRFRNREHMNAFMEDFIAEQTLEQLHGHGGRAAKKLTLADVLAPAGLDDVTKGRMREIQHQLRQRYQTNRPLNLGEKEKAGLILDPVYSIARYAATMAHDNTTAEFFNFIAKNPAWISDVATPGFTEVPEDAKFGRLSGKWVQDDIAGQVLAMSEAPGVALSIYDNLLMWWKTGKTVLNPGTHVRNVLGNVFFSNLAGTGVHNPGNVQYYRDAIKAMRAGGPVLIEAYDAGVLGGDFVSSELRSTLRAMLPDPATIVDDGKAPGILMGMGKAIGKVIPKWAANPLSKGFNHVTAMYQAEDEVFKLAAFLKAKAMGMSSKDAASHVRQWFPYYDGSKSGTLKLAGRTVMPFLSFYRESIRIFGQALQHRPLALMAGLAVPSVITFISAMMMGLDDDDLEQVKKDMRGKAGKLLGPTPLGDMPLFSMLLPFESSTGQLQQFDISAIHPFVDFLGTRVDIGNDEDWFQKTIRSFIAAGPIGSLVYSQMTGRDTFGDRTFVENNMTGTEKTLARGDNILKTLLPPLLPGGTGFHSLMTAGERQTNKTFESRNAAQSVLRAVGGLDVRNATPDIYRIADDWRAAQGLKTSDGMDFSGSTPASRARKALFATLSQDSPNLDAVANLLKRLDTMGAGVKTPADLDKLIRYKNPLFVIHGAENQQRFRSSLTGLEREALESSLAEFAKIKAKAPSIIARSRAR